ncbi:13262_t:CDS:2 [Ambispora gerdemannii]|uniref:13262_t:CDS:1 n=1 Tax=Ambispora gerdemannii TaxID=144530 RepID=A0A9N9FXN4_9GLOM|nr:13262_t:CDS:2 [Ambispora gerdemannii]
MGISLSAPGLRKKKSNVSLAAKDDNDAETIENKYYLPSKIEDIDRMQIQHFLYQHIWQCNFSSPIENMLNMGGYVIDIGDKIIFCSERCGPGTWVLEMATEYPMTCFTGVDIVPTFPSQIMPRNVKFLKGNILRELPIEDKFDFARLSLLGTSFNEKEWPRAIEQTIKLLKPGGWIEICELDLLPNSMGPCFEKITTAFMGLLSKRGVNSRIVLKLDSLLAGSNSLSKVQFDLRRITAGHRGGKPGILFAENLAIYFKSVVVSHLQSFMNLSPEGYQKLWSNCEQEFEICETQVNIYRFWGRKS